MYFKMNLLCVIVCISLGELVDSQLSKCTPPEGGTGTCVSIDDCPKLADFVRHAPKPLPQRVQDYFRKLSCGRLENNKNGICCISPSINITQEAPSSDTPLDTNSLLPSSICGQTTADKISNGELADLGEFPWMALLRYKTFDKLDYRCGGSIINSRYILTAAHCVSHLRSGHSLHSVVVGEQKISTNPDCVNDDCNNEWAEYLVEEIIPHESYSRQLFSDDIALVRVSKDIDLTGDFVRPVCLPVAEALRTKANAFLIVSGFGTTENMTTSDDLLKARLNIVPIADCRAALHRPQFDDRQLCGVGKGPVDTCKGDSGGPLGVPSKVSNNVRFVQYGIVSAGVKGCGELDQSKPGVYVNVPMYMDWILSKIRK